VLATWVDEPEPELEASTGVQPEDPGPSVHEELAGESLERAQVVDASESPVPPSAELEPERTESDKEVES